MLQVSLFAFASAVSLRSLGFSLTSNVSLLFFSLAVRKWPIIQRALTHVNGLWVLALLSAILIYRLVAGLWTSRGTSSSEPRVLFFPSRTTHIRFFPQRHSFAYSYLLAGIPVGFQGSLGGLISVDQESCEISKRLKTKTWYSVDAEDYLERGSGHLGLRGKLEQFLINQGHDPQDYPHAYLFTSPKFLGYFNNPVSFWYLYDSDRTMKAMILEVNNTFEERRMYLLTPRDDVKDQIEAPDSPIPATISEPTTRFSQTWPKDFHVSPFSSRKGSYTLNTTDPLAPFMSKVNSLSATITLLSSKSEPKLVARIFSQGPPHDPGTMSLISKLKFLLTWWWIVYVTFPRVAYQASKLWFKRHLHVWARPEPYTTTLSRSATASETLLESHFLLYLRHLIQQCPHPLHLTYTPTGIKNATSTTLSSPSAASTKSPAESKIIHMKILTPAFYTRFIHYAHDLEAFFAESTESATIQITNAQHLPLFIYQKQHLEPQSVTCLLDHLVLCAVRKLRRRPARLEAVAYIGKKVDSAQNEKTASRKDPRRDVGMKRSGDLRRFRNSCMDAFMFMREKHERRRYGFEVLRVLVADWIAMGDVGVLWLEWFLVRMLGIWWLSRFVL